MPYLMCWSATRGWLRQLGAGAVAYSFGIAAICWYEVCGRDAFMWADCDRVLPEGRVLSRGTRFRRVGRDRQQAEPD